MNVSFPMDCVFGLNRMLKDLNILHFSFKFNDHLDEPDEKYHNLSLGQGNTNSRGTLIIPEKEDYQYFIKELSHLKKMSQSGMGNENISNT